MKKLKITLSVIVMFLVSGGVAWAVVQSLNGQSGSTQTFSNDANVTISSATDNHALGWTGRLSVSRGGTGSGSFTSGSVLFASTASISQDNSNFFWDNTNKRLGVGTNTPSQAVDVSGTVKANQVVTNTVSATGTNQSLFLNPTGTGELVVGGDSIVVASKSSAPTGPRTGQIYFDTTLGKFRGYNGSNWVTFAVGKRFQVDTNGSLESNLVAYWKLDEPTGAREDFWDNHNMALGTEPNSTAGKIGNAADFTRTSSEYITAGNDSAFNNPGDFSVAFWIKTGDSTNQGYVLSKWDSMGWTISINAFGAGYIGATLQSGPGAYVQRHHATSLADGNWHYVIFTRTGNIISFYVDGGAESSVDSGSSGTLGSLSNTAEVRMGFSSSGTFPLQAAVDETGFWTKVLSSQERTDLWNSGNGQTMTK